MKTLNENKKGWIRKFAYTATLVMVSQVFIACGGGGGGNNSTPVTPILVPNGVGVANFSANCASGSATTVCAMGTYPGMEVLMQVTAAQVGGSGTIPVQVTGVVNILPQSGCPAASYSFQSSQMVYSSYAGTLQGFATGSIQIQLGNEIMTPQTSTSSTGQVFQYRLMGGVQMAGASNVGVGIGTQGGCVPNGTFVLN